MSDRSRDVATTGVGLGLASASAVMQDAATRRQHTLAHRKRGKFPGLIHLRPGVRGPGTGRARVLYGAGGALGIVGMTGAGTGVYRLAHPHDASVEKKLERTKDFVTTGLAGVKDATQSKIENTKDNPDPRTRALPYAVGFGAGFGGSVAVHRGLDRFANKARHGKPVHWAARAALTRPGAAIAAPLVGIPTANVLQRHMHSDYVATPSGVKRRGKKYRPPSAKASVFDQKKMGQRRYREATVGKVHNPHNLTHVTRRGTPRKVHWRRDDTMSGVCGLDGAFGRGTGPFADNYGEVTCEGCKRMMSIRKADDDYLGRRVTPMTQRARTSAAGAVPVPFVGPLSAARQAGRYAPPGEKRQAQARQLSSSVGSTAAGVGGAYWAASSSRVGHGAETLHGGVKRAVGTVTSPVTSRMKKPAEGAGRIAGAKAGMKARAAGAALKHPRLAERAGQVLGPLARNKKAAIAGYAAGKMISGQPMGQLAISRNIAAQNRYNLKHPVNKLASAPEPLSRSDKRKLLERKKRNAALSTTTASLGLAGTALGTALIPGIRRRIPVKHATTLERAALGTSLAAGGISGYTGLRAQKVNRRELADEEHRLSKALVRAPSFRRSTYRVVRSRNGSTHSVRVRESVG